MKPLLDPARDAPWRVRRQDDNGNVFEVARDLTRAAAERLAATLSASGHKQIYWVERASFRSPGAA
ncbi:MAG: SPOR domain-containing protein [Gammaproteobacteria bacterium]